MLGIIDRLRGSPSIEANPSTDLAAAVDDINTRNAEDEIEAGMPDLVTAVTSNDLAQSLERVDEAMKHDAAQAVHVAEDPAELDLLGRHSVVAGRMVTYLETREEQLESILRSTQESLRQTKLARLSWSRLSQDLEDGKAPRPKPRKRSAPAPKKPAARKRASKPRPNQSAPH